MSQHAIKKASVADLLAMPEDGRYELIAGQIVPRDAATFEHSTAQSGIAAWTTHVFHRNPDGPSGGWWIATEAEVEKPSGRPIAIVPDWVCEVLSSNWRNDTVTKFETCFQHHVGHYWIADPERRVLTVYRWHAEGWLHVRAVTPGERARLEPFEAVEFEVAVLFGDDPGPEPAKIVG
jgi:Uma2 family endonuclease